MELAASRERERMRPSGESAAQAGRFKLLKITRTYRDEETGAEVTKVEVVKAGSANTACSSRMVVDAYVNIKETKDEQFVRVAFGLDELEREKLRREKRKLQEV